MIHYIHILGECLSSEYFHQQTKMAKYSVFLETSFSFPYFFPLSSRKESSQVIVFMSQNVKISDKHI